MFDSEFVRIETWEYLIRKISSTKIEIWHHVTPDDGGYGTEVKMEITPGYFDNCTVEDLYNRICLQHMSPSIYIDRKSEISNLKSCLEKIGAFSPEFNNPDAEMLKLDAETFVCERCRVRKDNKFRLFNSNLCRPCFEEAKNRVREEREKSKVGSVKESSDLKKSEKEAVAEASETVENKTKTALESTIVINQKNNSTMPSPIEKPWRTLSTDYTNKCGNCHSYLGKDKYCKYCGTKRGEGKFEPYENFMGCVYGSPVSYSYKCKRCGKKFESGGTSAKTASYCPECGFADINALFPEEPYNYKRNKRNNNNIKNSERIIWLLLGAVISLGIILIILLIIYLK